MNNKFAAGALTAAIFLSACAAPTPNGTPTAAVGPTQPARITPPTPAGQAVQTAPTSAPQAPTQASAPAAPAGDRPYAKLTPQQRGNIGKTPPPVSIDVSKKYIATIKTSKGDIKVELDPGAAPQTVNNFIYLSQNGFYDGLTFHRVEPGFVIQGGDPAGNGSGGPGYTVPAEIKLPHIDGAIAMARLPDNVNPKQESSGSQFYITIGAQTALDGAYTAFGKTISGLDIVRKIAVGDKIDRVEIAVSTGEAVAAAPAAPVPTAAPAKPAECRIVTDTFGIEEPNLTLLKDDHVFGKVDATSTLVEYGDPQCPACAAFQPMVKTLLASYSDTLKIVSRHYPLTSIHDKALVASRALEAANEQGKFSELQDLLYSRQTEWSSVPITDFNKTLDGFAKELKMDVDKFDKSLASPEIAARVDRDIKSGTVLQLQATPSLFLDGQPIPSTAFSDPNLGPNLASYLKRRAGYKTFLAAKPLRFAKPESVSDGKSIYEVTLKTSKGDVVLELDPKIAPVNVNSFLFLAQKGYYNDTKIQLNDAQVNALLFSDPSGSGLGTSGYECDSELSATPATAWKTPGTVALFKSTGQDADQTGSQIVITFAESPQLAGAFTVIGQVTKGLELAKMLAPDDGKATPDKIVSVSVIKK